MEVWGDRAISYRDVAVLCRTHQTLEAYRSAPCVKQVSRTALLVAAATPIVKKLQSCARLLRAIESPSDAVALVATLRSGMFGFSDEELAAFMSEGGQLDYMHAAATLTSGALEELLVAAAFTVLQQLHQRRTQVSPATLLTKLPAKTHILPVFALHGQGGAADRESAQAD